MQISATAKPVDLGIVATKFSGLQEALHEMQGLVGPKTIIFSVLNGISSEEFIKERYGDDNLLYCVALGMDAVREGTSLTYQHKGVFKAGHFREKAASGLGCCHGYFGKGRHSIYY